jgi:hypothetical protein
MEEGKSGLDYDYEHNIADAFAEGVKYALNHGQRIYSFVELYPAFNDYCFSFEYEQEYDLDEEVELQSYNSQYEESLSLRKIIDRDWIVEAMEQYATIN